MGALVPSSLKSPLEVVFCSFQFALVPDGIVAQMQLHCFVNHSGTGPFVFEALHQFTLGDSIKRPFPKKYKGKPFSCFNQTELLLLLVAIRSYVIDICQWIYLPLVCQSRDQFHDIIQRKLLSCFNELNLLLCWF